MQPVSPNQNTTISIEEQPSVISDFPPVYHDLTEAFSKAKTSQLPPHHDNICAIEQLPGTMPPRGQIFPLLQH